MYIVVLILCGKFWNLVGWLEGVCFVLGDCFRCFWV